MKRWLTFSLFLILPFSIFGFDIADQNSIRNIVGHFANAWNNHEGRGFADYYAEDADFVNIFGMTFSGKPEIERRHIQILETFLKGSNFEVIDQKLREVKPGLVIALVYWKVTGIQKPGESSAIETMKGVFTHTFVKNGEKWEIVSTQNTLITNR